MDQYLDEYVNRIMDDQIYRSGIDLFPSWLKRIFRRK